MKKLLFILVLGIGLGSFLKAQDYTPTKSDLDAFLKTTTLVVLEDDPLREYNVVIKDVIEKEWKITPFEFIQFKDFDAKRKDPKYSFLMTTSIRFDKDKTDARYNFLNLLLGGDYYALNGMPSLVSVPLSYMEVDEGSYTYKLAVLVRFMQNHLNMVIKDPSLLSSNIFKHYNDNMGDVKSKTLYLIESELAPEVNSEARIRAVYPYKFKIVTADEVEDAIKNHDDNVVFLHKVGPEGTRSRARCYKILVGASDAKIYYFDYHMIDAKKPDGFLLSDFKKLARK